MPHRSPRRSKVALVLAAGLVALVVSGPNAPAVQFLAAGTGAAANADPGGVAWFWQVLSSLGGIRPEAGCVLDPNGGCVHRPARRIPGRSGVGCRLDPNGRCVSGQNGAGMLHGGHRRS